MTITAELPTLTETARDCPCATASGAPVWCVSCTHAVAADLQRLHPLATYAAGRRDGRLLSRRAGNTEVKTARLTPASPSPAWDALDEIVGWARGWAERCADQLQRRHQHLGAYNNAGLPMLDLAGDLDYLLRFITPLLVGPWATQFGWEVSARASALERLAGQEMARHALAAPCPTCDRLSLWRLDGTDRVECGAPDCYTVLTWADYQGWSTQLAAGGGW